MSIINKEAECDNCEPEHKHHSSSKLIFKVEKSMIKTAFYNLIFLILIETIAYFGFFKNIPDFFSKYGYYLIFLVISIVINSMMLWHIKAYRHVFSCTTGMMIGMTVGMSAGFSIGIIVGMIMGSYAGSCCGIMGIMEGMMAGLMGGLMGGMTSVMTINDNIKYFVPLLIFSMLIILIGLIVMLYEEEIKKKDHVEYKGFQFLPFITVNFIITIMLTFLMVYGPRSFLFG